MSWEREEEEGKVRRGREEVVEAREAMDREEVN